MRAVGSGSRASAAPASPGTRSSRARGARRSPGWDRKETPYLAHVREAGIPVNVSDEAPEPPTDAEAVVSTAYAGKVQGRSRAEFLAELVALRRSIVVGGAHGKTTTAAMIAYCLDRLGDDPSFLIGGEVAQLGGNARAGEGWLVVEGDESDGTVFSLPADIAVVTNVDLDHHSEFSSTAELEERFAAWAALDRRRPCRLGPRRGAGRLRARRAGAAQPHQRRLRPGRARARPASTATTPREAIAGFRGAGRRLEEHGRAGDVLLVDDYAHHPAELAATIAAARTLADGRLVVLFQPHLYSRTIHVGRELGVALAAADAAVVTEIYAAREDPVAGVSGKLVVDSAAEARPGMPVGWAPELADAARLAASLARPGGVVLTVGAGDVDGAIPLLQDALGG